ncbi:hypothetical protein PTI98_003231 [Pleurotus ostreatus]|nr:hypothetical protein PTI98_003231 [Pleurotus ostreatus]
MSESPLEPFLVVEKLGNARGRPIYVVTKHIPKPGQRDQTKEIRCMDLVGEAFGSYKAQQGGCHHTQFFNDTDDLT